MVSVDLTGFWTQRLKFGTFLEVVQEVSSLFLLPSFVRKSVNKLLQVLTKLSLLLPKELSWNLSLFVSPGKEGIDTPTVIPSRDVMGAL